MLHFPFLVLIFLAHSSSRTWRISNIGGPFRTEVERFEQCSGGSGGSGAAVFLSVQRVSRPRGPLGPGSRPQRITGNLTLLEGLDDSMTIAINIEKWSNNQWKRNAFILRLAELCTLMQGAGVLGAASCPVIKGVYCFTDLETDWRIPIIPEFHYGKWRARAVFGKSGESVGCVQFLFQTSPALYGSEQEGTVELS